MVTNNAINQATGALGTVVQGQGVGTATAFSTATYPSTATGTGSVLRADGTNWSATTATYPNTTTANQLLYSSATNTVAGLATATNSTLVTDGSGVPSISATLPSAVQGNITSVGTLTSGTWNATTIAVNHGGTGQTTLTNHGVLVGAGTSAITQLAAGSSGQVLQSGGASADPAYSTATYPTTATSTGVILRADGTNWSATTATYPNTTTINQILYSSSANTIAGLATANGGVLDTTSTGVPQVDTTNFSVLSTGVQIKGNNTNTAPPAGFIGERISSATTGVSLTSTNPANITSINLTAGIWDISCVGIIQDSTLALTFGKIGISTNTGSFTGTVSGDSFTQLSSNAMLANSVGLSISGFRATLSSTTTYYLVGQGNGTGTLTADGRISGTRVG